MRRTQPFFAAVLFFVSISTAHAGYKRTGDVSGWLCTSYIIISKCKWVDVDAVSEDGVKFFTIKETFDSVSEFNSSANLCHIKLSTGWISWAAGKLLNATRFYTKNNAGGFDEIHPEYVSFKCEPM